VKYNYLTLKIEEYITHKKNPTNLYTMNLHSDNKRVESVYELSIPTCSYRMGVPNMGYGMLTITPQGKAYVSILWLPSRFSSIKLYTIYVIFIILFFVLNFSRKYILKLLEFMHYKYVLIKKKKQSMVHQN
jgi:hypothetical protein